MVDTPRSHLVHKPTAKEAKKKRRELEKEITKSLVQSKEEQACDLVLQNLMG